MAAGYHARSSSNKSSAPTPFHHPPRPLPERSRTEPVAVPNVQRAPPPPLPPPRHVDNRGQDLGWQMANAEQAASLNGSSLVGNSTPIKPGSSLLGSGLHQRPEKSNSAPERRVDFLRQEVPRSTPAPSLLTTLKAHRPQELHQQPHHQPHQPHQPHQSHQARPRAPSDTGIPDLRELLEYNKLQSEKQMGNDTLKRSSVAYDKQLLSRIGVSHGPLTPNAGEPTSSPVDASNTLNRLNGQLLPLSLMANRGGTTTPPSAGPSALSPGISGLRSPLSDSGLDHAPPLPSFPRQHQTRSISPHSSQQHYFQTTSSARSSFSGPGDSPLSLNGRFSVNPDLSLSAFRDLRVGSLGLQGHIMSESQQSPTASGDYQSSKTGQKRRAQSPPGESVIDPSLPADSVEPWQRASNNPLQLAGRGARFLHHNQQPQSGSSISTSSSSSAPRNSYGSSLGMSNPSTVATSYSSERISPTMYAPAGDNTAAKNQAFMSAYQATSNSGIAANSGTSQPALLASSTQPQAQAQVPTLSTAAYLHRENNGGILRAPGLWICDCCPKKPKKFESEEELRIHEMEKQYICQYCHNRFKNKNEAERHQNSLHLRRHSWSCSALTSFEAAFHPTPVNNLSVHFNRLQQENAGNFDNKEELNSPAYQRQQPTPTDTCGYCGLEFMNPPNWDERIEHLNHVHKFGECNQNKKFFRADHFRQHLKHSHAGTSGKWTNVLENACMKDEPPPQPIAPGILPGVPNAMPGGVPGIAMVGQQALLAAHQLQQQQAQQAAQQAVQQQQQQHGSPTAPQATMASMLSSALNQQSASQDHHDQSAFENDQGSYGGEVKAEPQHRATEQSAN